MLSGELHRQCISFTSRAFNISNSLCAYFNFKQIRKAFIFLYFLLEVMFMETQV